MAAEPSGDLQAGALARALRRRDPALRLVGVGGAAMAAAGVELWMESHTWSTIGPGEALARIPGLYLAYRRMRGHLLRERPQLTVVLDAPALHMRLVGFLRRRGLRTAYYFPPSAWSRNPRRMHEIHSRVDGVLCAFRANAQLYDSLGLPVAFFGHPLSDVIHDSPGPEEAREILGVEGPALALLPGSRTQEVRHLLPTFLEVAARLRRDEPGLQILLPCATSPLEKRIRSMLGSELPEGLRILSGQARLALAASRLALMASGSASLESALLGVPMLLCYRFGPLDAALGRTLKALGLLRVNRFGLPNLVLDRDVVPELLQEEVQPDRVEAVVRQLWKEGPVRDRMLADLARVQEALGGPGVVDGLARVVDFLAAGDSMTQALARTEP
jgi:lipid-A-disaccharide synthase